MSPAPALPRPDPSPGGRILGPRKKSRLPTVTPLRPPARLAPALVRALPGWEVRLTVYVTGGECRYRAHALTTRYLPGCVLALDVPGAPSDGERPAWVALVDATLTVQAGL